MQQLAGKENNLVLLRNDGLVTAIAYIHVAFQARIVDLQLSAFELARFAMEEIHKRQVARSHPFTGVITVEVKKVSVIAGSDLRLDAADGEFFHFELFQNLGQD